MSNLVVRDKSEITPDAAWYALPDEYRRGQLGHQVSSELAEIGQNPQALTRYLHGVGVEVVQLREDVDDLRHRVSSLEQGQGYRAFPSRHAGDPSLMGWVTSLNLMVGSALIVVAGFLLCTIYVVRLTAPTQQPVEVSR